MSLDLGMVTAYSYAVAGGYTGTQQEFEELLGNIATDLAEIENLSVTVTTLPAGSQATASYNNGVLSLGIPKGDKGDTGETGQTGPTGPTGNGIQSIAKTGTAGNVDTYTITYTNGQTTTFTVTNGSVTSVDGKTGDVTLDDKANIDGYYEDLTAGYAENLISNVFDEESVPYNFRTAGGSLDIGAFENDEVVGGSLAVNQLIAIPSTDRSKTENGVTFTDNRDGTYTVSTSSGGATANSAFITGSANVINGHKYYFAGTPSGGSNSTYFSYMANNAVITTVNDIGNGRIYSAYGTGVASVVSAYITSGTVITTPITFKSVWIDLTLLFGTTIADYIYTLETGQAGAGVAWFKKLFPKSYYPYNTGELMHVQTSGHKMVGFNAFDVSTGKAKLVGGMQYEIVGTYSTVSYSDINGDAETLTISGGKFTPTNNGTLTVTGGDSTTCVHLVWDGERDGEYEAYTEHIYPLDSDLVLRGVPKLDSGNNLYYDGDTYESDGTVTRRYGIVDMGTLNWELYSGSIFRVDISGKKNATSATTIDNLVCSKYQVTTGNNVVLGTLDKAIGASTSNGRVFVQDTSYTSASTFKTAMSGVYLVYELATPTTETADTFQSPQAVSNWGTEEYIDTRSIPIPVGHNTKYPPDLKAKLETSPNPPDADGEYLVKHVNGTNEYVALSSNATIQDILNRLAVLEA